MSAEPVEAYDPALHDSPAWKYVECTRCQSFYQCTPWNDFMTPADDLGWDKGGVCENCLLALARAKS
ncbi:MAG: hypothetical protein JWO67_4695 [Streptosporangiaceae bacterium]|nr:hypothetical protein [Streptosporangiaceae bacterium]